METKTKLVFPGQQANEKVHLVFRQHWAVLLMKLSLWFALLIAYFAIDYISIAYLPNILDQAFIPLIQVFKIVFLMFLALGLFMIFVLYYLNMSIVTNERIVDIEQEGLLHHTISELHLDQIQDVTAEVHGLPENLFDYGDVYIQTAGETQRFLFHKIPNPTKVTQLILDLYEQLPENQKPTLRPAEARNQNRPA